jgi:hypothetical protein
MAITNEKIAQYGSVTGEVTSQKSVDGNIVVGSNPNGGRAVLYTEQQLTDEQTSQARRNIKTAGESVEGTTYVPYTVEEIDGYNYNFIYEEPVVAQEGAEIFNDYGNIAAGLWSTATGYQTQALGNYSSANGWWTRADGQCAVANGLLTRASGHFTHAEGTRTLASINNAHAEGDMTKATGRQSHAEGVQTIASGYCAHAEGSNTQATNYYSHAEGLGTIAAGRNQTAMGKYNISDTKSLVIVGNGSKDTTRSNAYKLDANGNGWFEGTVASTGADYAEYFEWLDGNPDGEDRIGRVVTLDGEKIRYANADDNYILGIISGTALILGDNPGDEWKDKFLKDDYGRFLTETVEDFIEYYDYETGENVVESTGFVNRKVLNPAFNPDDEYITRKERNEWEIVGMMGKLHVIDDGTCVPNGYAKVSHDGIVTHSDKITTMRVMKRINDHIILILKKTANDHESIDIETSILEALVKFNIVSMLVDADGCALTDNDSAILLST